MKIGLIDVDGHNFPNIARIGGDYIGRDANVCKNNH
jgi:hypothetical protein